MFVRLTLTVAPIGVSARTSSTVPRSRPSDVAERQGLAERRDGDAEGQVGDQLGGRAGTRSADVMRGAERGEHRLDVLVRGRVAPTKIASRPAVASGTLPRTGASTRVTALAVRRPTEPMVSGPTVDMSMSHCPGLRAGTTPSSANSDLLERLRIREHGDDDVRACHGVGR